MQAVVNIHNAIRGFEYTNLTCAFDTILTSLLVLYDSETTQNKLLFGSALPYLSSSFDKLLDGSTSYALTKQQILNKIFYDVEGGFKRNSNQMIAFVTEFLFNPMTLSNTLSDQEHYFLLYYDDIKSCTNECCEINGSITTPRETCIIATSHDLNHESSMNAMISEFFHNNRRHYYCETCGIRMAEEKSITKLPRVIYISLCGTPITYDIDREIIINDVHYVLMIVTYSGSGHFTCRMNYNNRVVEYDGLKAGGKFRDVNDINAFNGVIRELGNTKREAVQIFYKMRDD